MSLATERLGERRIPLPVVRTRHRRFLLFRGMAVLAVLAIVGPISARDSLAQGPTDPSLPQISQASSAFMPAERGVILLLDRTRQLLAENRYSEAVQCLDRILSGSEDFFFKAETDSSVHRSIKTEARRLLGSIHPSGRQSYELQFGSLARSMLDEAVETGNMAAIAEVARRFFHTEAGYEATYLLGMHHMDHGRPLVAALTLRRLYDESPRSTSTQYEPSLSLSMARSWLAAEMPEEAREALDALRESYRDRIITIEGRGVPLFGTNDDSVEWLLATLGTEKTSETPEPTNWKVRGGSPQRNAISKASRPLLSPNWSVPATDHPAVETLIHQLRRQQEEREEPLLPGLHPLVVDDVVLMRTATNLLAVDLETGKRLWEVPANDPFETLLNPPLEGHVSRQPNIEAGLRLRLWGDAVFGTLASDGRQVFAVEDLQLPLPAIYTRGLMVPGNVRSSSASLLTSNRLAAFDLRSEGKLRWEIGGSHAEKLPLAGAFFLGPPLPLLGDLYVLAEIDGEVRVLALDAKSGKLLWEQQLAVVDQTVHQDSLRRVSGVSPSYADGVLICPTSHHSIVALELTTRSLLWGYSYAELEHADEQRRGRFATFQHRLANPEERWTDSSLVVADGCVLATPTDSEQLHCLSLRDGKLLWHAPREDKLFIATVDHGKVVVATRKGLTALNLDNGEPAWKTPLAECPTNSQPSGHGFSDGELYYLPLTGSKLMIVRLATGNVEQVVRSRHGRTLGNLVCHKGKIVSQRADSIESYHQLEALRREVNERLATRPDDARALALRGEILWDDGNLNAAVDCFRKSYRMSDTLRTRTLFREAMLDGLKKDFAVYHAFRDEIESLLETADDWATFHRLIVNGWEAAGEYDKTLAEFRLLVDLDFRHSADEGIDLDAQIGEDYSVRQHRWIRTRLLDLAKAVPAGTRTELLRWVDEKLRSQQETSGPDEIGRALRYFDGLPETRKYKETWIERLVADGRLTEAELALMQDVRPSSGDADSQTTERWVSLLVNADRPADAASLLSEIETRWPDVPFGDNQSRRQWAVDYANRHDTIRQSRLQVPWPRGLVKTSLAESERENVALAYSGSYTPFENTRGRFFADLVIEHRRHQDQQIVAKNASGQVEWRFSLSSISERERYPVNQVLTGVDSCGHLLILSLGNQIIALDTLAMTEDGTPTIAWHETLDQMDLLPQSRRNVPVQLRNGQNWLGAQNPMAGGGHTSGTTFVVGEHLVCLKRSRSCTALDPATGNVLWERSDMSAQSLVFGDDRHVLITSPQTDEAIVLRAEDGAELKSCPIPPREQRLMTLGREILCWEPHTRQADNDPVRHEELRLCLIDPLESDENRVVWGPLSYDAKSKPRPQLVNHDLLAVFTPEGKFQLIRLTDGKVLIDTQIETKKSLSDIVVFPREGHYLVVANDNSSGRNPKRHVSPIGGLRSRRIGHAKVYCFDSEGAPVWEQPTVVEDHSLPLVQPKKAPCLTFARMVRETTPGQPRETGAEVLCLDTRSGAIVAEERLARASHALEIVAVPEESKVEIRMQQETLSLLFTDEPIPEGGYPHGTARAPDSPLEAIWRAVTEGATAREAKYHFRRSSPENGEKEAEPSQAVAGKDKAAPADDGKKPVGAKEADQQRKVAVPPPLEPAVRGEITPE